MVFLALLLVVGCGRRPVPPQPARLPVAGAGSGSVAYDGRRVALVVGNGRYRYGAPVPEADRNAQLLAGTLRDLGFEVQTAFDTDKNSLTRAIADLEAAARGADVALLYYAGHAIQRGGRNYLLPVSADLTSHGAAVGDGVDATRVLQRMNQAHRGLDVMILDAGPGNPLDGAALDAEGLAVMPVTGSSVVVFSTLPGTRARSDGTFARALANEVRRPCRTMAEALRDVRDVVRSSTGQQPWVEVSGSAASRFEPAGCYDGNDWISWGPRGARGARDGAWVAPGGLAPRESLPLPYAVTKYEGVYAGELDGTAVDFRVLVLRRGRIELELTRDRDVAYLEGEYTIAMDQRSLLVSGDAGRDARFSATITEQELTGAVMLLGGELRYFRARRL